MSTYSDKLKDPRWQKKRLKIFERDGWECKICKRKKQTLHIHHKKYSKWNLWDIADDKLICICEICHRMIHIDNFKLKEVRFFYSKKYNDFLSEFHKTLWEVDPNTSAKYLLVNIKALMKCPIK